MTHLSKRYICRLWAAGHRPASAQQGLTLIECLVAIIMVGLVGSAIAPALVISVATRVQSQKAEQALELAQSEIDSVRLLIERGDATADDLPPAVAVAGELVANVPGPSGAPVDPPTAPTALQTRRVGLDGGNEFALQVFRTPGRFVGDVPVTFALGVRVYDINSIQPGGGALPTAAASLGTTGTTADSNRRPLAALYTTITAGESGNSLCEYMFHLDNAAALPTGCTVAP